MELKNALHLSELWENGKMIGGDGRNVRKVIYKGYLKLEAESNTLKQTLDVAQETISRQDDAIKELKEMYCCANTEIDTHIEDNQQMISRVKELEASLDVAQETISRQDDAIGRLRKSIDVCGHCRTVDIKENGMSAEYMSLIVERDIRIKELEAERSKLTLESAEQKNKIKAGLIVVQKFREAGLEYCSEIKALEAENKKLTRDRRMSECNVAMCVWREGGKCSTPARKSIDACELYRKFNVNPDEIMKAIMDEAIKPFGGDWEKISEIIRRYIY